MKTYRLTLSVAATMAAGVTLAQAQQAIPQDIGNEQLQHLQAQATGAAFEVADSQFRVVPNARVVEQSGSNAGKPGSDLLVSGYQVQLQATNKRQARSTRTPVSMQADKHLLVISEGGAPAVLTSTMTVFFDDASALQRAARAVGGKVGYASAVAGIGSIEFDSARDVLEAIPQVLGQAGISDAEPELIQGKEEAQ